MGKAALPGNLFNLHGCRGQEPLCQAKATIHNVTAHPLAGCLGEQVAQVVRMQAEDTGNPPDAEVRVGQMPVDVGDRRDDPRLGR